MNFLSIKIQLDGENERNGLPPESFVSILYNDKIKLLSSFRVLDIKYENIFYVERKYCIF